MKLYDIDIYWSDYPEYKSEITLSGESEEDVIREAKRMYATFPLTNGTHKELPPPDRVVIVKTYE